MDHNGANGIVQEINLTSVKIQNWDHTTTTVPTYSLISQPFKNWKAMYESGGRQIQRVIYIDIDTIKYCTPEMLDSLSKVDYLSDFIKQNRQGTTVEASRATDTGDRPMTNLSLFRAYLTAYLQNHPMIRPDLLLIVRLLDSTEHGLPVEIWAFCRLTGFAPFNETQSEILEHIMAVIPEFGLRAFQERN